MYNFIHLSLDIVDPAILRPGRLDKILFVDFPNAEDRADIMRKSTKNGTKPRVSADFSFEQFAARPELDYYTGADLSALIHEASVVALKERLSTDNSSIDSLSTKHFETALQQIRPSVNASDRA
uniref:AAA_lid_3 domain-containing protein n=1 Tax=Steinernema glaseri TaxID=37863 RepID=A0A1I8AB60_9BILA